MTIIRREQWGARPPVGRRVAVPDRDRTHVVIHHTTGETLGKGDPAAWVRSIQRYHQSVQGWSDIGYHWLVAGDGTVFEGRGWDVVGAHCPGHNRDGWGIALLGDGTHEVPAAALRSIVDLVAQAETRAGHVLTLLGHRDVRPTACPGDALHEWLTDLTIEPPADAPPATSGAPAVAEAPAFPLEPGAFYGAGGVEHGEGLKRWQSRMRQRGWRGRKRDGTVALIEVDGAWGPQTADVARAFQTEKHLEPIDARVGRITWAAAWTEPVT